MNENFVDEILMNIFLKRNFQSVLKEERKKFSKNFYFKHSLVYFKRKGFLCYLLKGG